MFLHLLLAYQNLWLQLAKPENCGEGIFRLNSSVVYQIYG